MATEAYRCGVRQDIFHAWPSLKFHASQVGPKTIILGDFQVFSILFLELGTLYSIQVSTLT
jgi:hypothetical protein